MAQEITGTETKVTTTIESGVRTYVAERADGQRLAITRHRDGTMTLRIGRAGQGPAFTISDDATQLLFSTLF